MDQIKPFYASKTLWGGFAALIGGAINLNHCTISPTDAAQLVDLLGSLASAVGGILAILGRVSASKKIEGLS